MIEDIGKLLPGVGDTVLVTVAAYLLGAVLAVPLTLMRRSRFALVRLLSRTWTDLARAIPPITWLFLIFFGLAESTGIKLTPVLAAIVGLGLITSAYLSEVYRSGLLAIPRGQFEAARALGMSEPDVMIRVVVPQTLRVIVPPAATFAIALLKDSAIASTIGVTEITFRASVETQQTFDGLTFFVLAALLYILLSLPFAFLSRGIDRRLRAKFETA
jgi:polar amino acid transport system permease protein